MQELYRAGGQLVKTDEWQWESERDLQYDYFLLVQSIESRNFPLFRSKEPLNSGESPTVYLVCKLSEKLIHISDSVLIVMT